MLPSESETENTKGLFTRSVITTILWWWWAPQWLSTIVFTHKKQTDHNHFFCWCSDMAFNPFPPSVPIWHHLAKLSILRRDHQENFLWSSRLWVGRRKERFLDYVLKKRRKKNSRGKGLRQRPVWSNVPYIGR